MSSTSPNAQIQRKPNPWWVGFVCGMATFVDQAAITGVATALVLFQKGGLTGNQVGFLTASLTIGVAIGSLLGGRLGDSFGRRHIFTITMGIIVIGSFLPLFNTGFGFLLPAILLLGIGVGADLPVALATISETAEDKNRGKILVFSNLLGGFGILMSVLLGIFFGNAGVFGGKIIFAAFGAVAVITLLLRLTIPETDSWLRAHAEKAAGVHTERADNAALSDLFKKPYRKPFLTLVIYYALVGISITLASSFGTYVAYNIAHISVSTYSAVTLVDMPLAIVGAAWFMAVTDTQWRMPYYVIGSVLVTFSIAIPVIFGFNIYSLAALTYIATFAGAFCYETIMKVWTQESFPTMLRGSAQGAIYAVSRLIAAILSAVTPALLALNINALYICVTVLAAVGFFIGWLGFHKDAINTFDEERKDNAKEADQDILISRKEDEK